MSPEDRADFATQLRKKLDSRRDVFVVDEFMFEPQPNASERVIATDPDAPKPGFSPSKTISAACLRLLLDYCESNWDMDFVSYCAGIFHGREPAAGETAFDLLPDVKGRLSADRLGFSHIYGGE